MPRWLNMQNLVLMELKQRKAEGCDISGFQALAEAAGTDAKLLNSLYNQLMLLTAAPGFGFDEPSGLEEIRALRPDGPRKLTSNYSELEWHDKLLGAWQGRCAGCALGIPFEAGPYIQGSDGRPGWMNIKLWFEGANAWPIRQYAPAQSEAASQYGLQLLQNRFSVDCQLENIRFMTTDDDIRYTILGLLMMEEKGTAFHSKDVGDLWHRYLTYGQVHSAEGQAYLNYAQILLESAGDDYAAWENNKDWIRNYLNPFREWIGAQIRVDAYGYIAAGNPEFAAELAWRDASFSHVKNGIYGAMFVAAMIAAAFVVKDVERIVAIGLSEIPSRSRLAQDIHKAIAIAQSCKDQPDLVGQIWQAFCHYDAVHTNNNAALVAASLIFSKGDFTIGITTAVLGGWDTDCNGATVGSILGAMNGAGKLPQNWIAPLNDTIQAGIEGFHPITIRECARRTYEVMHANQQLK